jgi:hypothetical protein
MIIIKELILVHLLSQKYLIKSFFAHSCPFFFSPVDREIDDQSFLRQFPSLPIALLSYNSVILNLDWLEVCLTLSKITWVPFRI